MIEKRFVQWYAANSKVDLDIAEREIVLTYALTTISNSNWFHCLLFKGGTAIRKLWLGNQGRFSLDLDFTAKGEADPENLILDIVELFHNQNHFGIDFSVPSSDYYVTTNPVEQKYHISTNGFGVDVLEFKLVSELNHYYPFNQEIWSANSTLNG